MERDMAAMGLSEPAKEELRARWRQNETDYLREKRRKVDVSAFIKLKTIGHGSSPVNFRCCAAVLIDPRCLLGAFGVVSLVKERSTGQLYAMKQVTMSYHSNASCSLLLNSHITSLGRLICCAKARRVTSVPNGTFSNQRRL